MAALRTLVGDLAAASRAPATRRSYGSAWRRFDRWAVARGIVPFPASPETACLYLASLVADGRTVATIAQALVAVGQVHRDGGQVSPADDAQVRRVLRGIRRRQGVAQETKAAINPGDLDRMVAGCGMDLRGARDRALLTVGFASGMRRSELVALDVQDVAFVAEGMVLTLRRSKTDQEGAGRRIGVRFEADTSRCPVRALHGWLGAASVSEGAIFRTVTKGNRVTSARTNARTVARVVQSAAARAGLDPRSYAAHSLRSGCATSLAASGATERTIMRRLGHRTAAMSERYVRHMNVFE